MELIEAIETRRSVRSYDATKPISREDLQKIIEAAMYAPSALNRQPWEFFVVNDSYILAEIVKIHPYAGFIKDAGVGVIICENIDQSHNGYGSIDVALASQNFMLAAHIMGYGTCFCGLCPDESRMTGFANLLKLPKNISPIGLIVVGTPKNETPNKPSRFNSEKIHYNKW